MAIEDLRRGIAAIETHQAAMREAATRIVAERDAEALVSAATNVLSDPVAPPWVEPTQESGNVDEHDPT